MTRRIYDDRRGRTVDLGQTKFLGFKKTNIEIKCAIEISPMKSRISFAARRFGLATLRLY